MSRTSPITVTSIRATTYNDIVDFRTKSLGYIGDPSYTSSLVDRTYRINIQQSGVLGVISGFPAPVRGIIDSIPSEGSAIGNAQNNDDNIAFGIAYTLARDTNGNNILDSADQFIDYKVINSNVSGFVLFQKSVTPGTYFLELTDTTPSGFSRSLSGILFDPGPLYGEALSSIPDPKTPTNPNPNPTTPPDLSTRSFNIVPPALFAGETFPLELNIQNTGGRASGKFDIKVYISTNQTINAQDKQDKLIGSYSINNLGANDNIAGTVTPTLPSLNDSFWRGSQTYYIGMVLDSENDVTESRESNNIIYKGVEVFPIDPLQYGASNSDLIQLFGSNVEALKQHYRDSGRFENRSVNAFNPSQYLASNPDLILAFGNNPRLATEHYINSGFKEKRTINGFNPTQYLASHKDLISAFGNNPEAALDHFIQSGYKEKRSRDSFAEDIYLASHGDLIRAFGYNLEAATQHYINSGVSERRAERLFDPVRYLNKYQDLRIAFGNNLAAATQHYILSGFAEGRTWT